MGYNFGREVELNDECQNFVTAFETLKKYYNNLPSNENEFKNPLIVGQIQLKAYDNFGVSKSIIYKIVGMINNGNLVTKIYSLSKPNWG